MQGFSWIPTTKMRLFLLFIASIVLFGAAEPSWAWLADFQYRKAITITENSGDTLTDYQVRTEVSYEPEMQSDFGDIRFTDTSDVEIDYWLETYTPDTSATFWVEVPTIPASGSTEVYMYYHYIPGTATTTSDGAGTFSLFDDFDRPDNQTVGNGWSEVESSSTAEIASSMLRFTPRDDVKRPIVYRTMAALAGRFRWKFLIDWTRSGVENSYWIYMQLGDSSSMDPTQTGEPISADSPSSHTGTGVDLIWYRGAGQTHQVLSYIDGGAIQADVATISGSHTIEIIGDTSAETYDINVDGGPVELSGAGMNVTSLLDEIRFMTHGTNYVNFSSRNFGYTFIGQYVDPEPDTAFSGPTLVELAYFRATPVGSDILLEWKTETEIETVGFHILRSEREDGEYIQITPHLIPAEGGGGFGAEYSYSDHHLEAGLYYYVLQEIDAGGGSFLHGPVEAALGSLCGASGETGNIAILFLTFILTSSATVFLLARKKNSPD